VEPPHPVNAVAIMATASTEDNSFFVINFPSKRKYLHLYMALVVSLKNGTPEQNCALQKALMFFLYSEPYFTLQNTI
jgi:hypothetical protein